MEWEVGQERMVLIDQAGEIVRRKVVMEICSPRGRCLIFDEQSDGFCFDGRPDGYWRAGEAVKSFMEFVTQ